jgi:hypothetical protein
MTVMNAYAGSPIDPPAPYEPVAVDEYLADVLHRAHATAEADGEADEARAILHVAELFAEDLTSTNPRFDRLRFIHSVIAQSTSSKDMTT